MRLRDTLAAVAVIAFGAVILEGCATYRGLPICTAFDPRDFYPNRSGVSASGDLLIYSQPSVDCGQRPAWRSSRVPYRTQEFLCVRP